MAAKRDDGRQTTDDSRRVSSAAEADRLAREQAAAEQARLEANWMAAEKAAAEKKAADWLGLASRMAGELYNRSK